MSKAGIINHVPGVYGSLCCSVELSLPDNIKFPPCPGRSKSGESPCAGKNAEWTMVRPMQMRNR